MPDRVFYVRMFAIANCKTWRLSNTPTIFDEKENKFVKLLSTSYSYRCRWMNGESAEHFGQRATKDTNASFSFIRFPPATNVSSSPGMIVAKLVSAESGYALDTIKPSAVKSQICFSDGSVARLRNWTRQPLSSCDRFWAFDNLLADHVIWTLSSGVIVNTKVLICLL